MMNTFVINYLNVEFLSEDLPELFTYNDAIKECQSLGPGWRLPKADEMRFIFTLIPLGICNFKEPPKRKTKIMDSKARERYDFLIRPPDGHNYWYHWIQETKEQRGWGLGSATHNTIRLDHLDYPSLSASHRDGGYSGGGSELARVRPFRSL